MGWGRGFHVASQAGIAQSRPEFANWRPTHRLDPASRCVLFGPHGVFKKLAYLPTFINGNILHKNPEIWLLLENRLSSHSQSAFRLEQQQTGEKPPALWVQPVLSGSPQQQAQPPTVPLGLGLCGSWAFLDQLVLTMGVQYLGSLAILTEQGGHRPDSFADPQRIKEGV